MYTYSRAVENPCHPFTRPGCQTQALNTYGWASVAIVKQSARAWCVAPPQIYELQAVQYR